MLQKEAAKKVSITVFTIGAMERGRYKSNIENIIELCDLYGYTGDIRSLFKKVLV